MRIATWNVLHGIDIRRGCVDLAALAAGVEALDADVVALQETDKFQPRSDRADQVAELGRRLGYHGVFAPSLWGAPGTAWTAAPGEDTGGPAYGIGLLSRAPIRRWRRITLPGGGAGQRRRPVNPQRPGWDHEPRVLLQAEVDLAGRSVLIGTTHLSSMPWRSVRQLRRALRAQGAAAPAVLLGDFNLPPPLVGALAPGWRSAGGDRTYPSPEPRMQLDHILLRGLDVLGVEVAPAGPSDHLAVVAQVAVDT